MSTAPGFRRLVRTVAGHRPRTRQELESYQAACFTRLVRHAYRNVPYYRRLLDGTGIDPREIRSAKDLEAIPVTSREVLQSQPVAEIVSRDVDPGTLIELTTSGSTGRPVVIRRTRSEQLLLHGFLLRANRCLGLRARDHMAALSFLPPPHPRDRKMLGRAVRHAGLYRISRIDARQAPADILVRLRELRPQVITAYPSVLSELVGHLSERDRLVIQPRFLMSGAELLGPSDRRRIMAGFGAPVFDIYSSCEFHVIGWECPASGELHVSDDSVLLEVLSGGRPVRPGENGEIVATALHSYAMPIIRYELGDVVTRGSESCSCGEPYSTIRQVQGRVGAFIERPDGSTLHFAVLDRPVRRQDPPWMSHYQFVQERRDLLVLRVVPASAAPPGRLEEIKTSLSHLLGRGMRVEVRLVSEIPAEANGKLRSFVSRL